MRVGISKHMVATFRIGLAIDKPEIGITFRNGFFFHISLMDSKMQDFRDGTLVLIKIGIRVCTTFRIGLIIDWPHIGSAFCDRRFVGLLMVDGQNQCVHTLASVIVHIRVIIFTAVRIGLAGNMPPVDFASGNLNGIFRTFSHSHSKRGSVFAVVLVGTRYRIGDIVGGFLQNSLGGAAGRPYVCLSSRSGQFRTLPFANLIITTDTHNGQFVDRYKNRGKTAAHVGIHTHYGIGGAGGGALCDAVARATRIPRIALGSCGREGDTLPLADHGTAEDEHTRQGIDNHRGGGRGRTTVDIRTRHGIRHVARGRIGEARACKTIAPLVRLGTRSGQHDTFAATDGPATRNAHLG